MSHFRKIFRSDGSTVTIEDGVVTAGTLPEHVQTAYYMPDLDGAYGGGFTSPIDGARIESRPQLAEHNRRHGVMQVGDVRGQQLKDMNDRHQRYKPELIGKNFAWTDPER